MDKQRSDPRVRENRDHEHYRSNTVGPSLAQSTPRRPDYQQRQANQPRVNFARDNRAPQYNTYRPETRSQINSSRENYTPRTSNREFRTSTNEPRRNTGNDSNNKFCRYCKNPGHELEECKKRQYNNSRRNESGNANSLSGSSGATRWTNNGERVQSIQSMGRKSTRSNRNLKPQRSPIRANSYYIRHRAVTRNKFYDRHRGRLQCD